MNLDECELTGKLLAMVKVQYVWQLLVYEETYRSNQRQYPDTLPGDDYKGRKLA